MFQSTWESIGNKICMILIFKVICIFKGIIHYVETVCAAPHLKPVPDLNRLCTTKIQSQTTWLIKLCFQVGKMYADMQTTTVIWSIWKTVVPQDTSSSDFSVLWELISGWWKSGCFVDCLLDLSVCLCPGCVLDTDSPVKFHAVFLTAPEGEGWHIINMIVYPSTYFILNVAVWFAS